MKSVSGFASFDIEWLAPLGTLAAVTKTSSGIHGTLSLSFATCSVFRNMSRFRFVVLLVEVTRENLGLSLTHQGGWFGRLNPPRTAWG